MFRQMEKLIELLNEYGNEICNHWGDYPTDMDEFTDRDTHWYLSKKFWFIKWLVENEKIEYRKIIEKEIEVWFKLVRIKDYPNKIKEEDVEELLMLLSIQDEPIEFLVSILK